MVVAAISEEAASTTTHNLNPKTSSQNQEDNGNGNDNNTHFVNPSKRRPPLLPSEKDNNTNRNNNGSNDQRKPRSRQVSSRYLSPSPSTSTTTTTTTTTSSSSSATSSSRRFPSPLVSRSTNFTPSSVNPVPGSAAAAPKRSQSVDRRRSVTTSRPMTPGPDSRLGNVGEVLGVSAASKLLFTSTRSLSVSFQGEAFSLPISKAKTPNSSSVRKGTPERRRATPLRGKVEGNGVVGGGDHVENSRPLDQRRWPGKTRQANPLLRSLDCSVDRKKFIGSDIMGGGRTLQQSLIDESSRVSFDGRLSLDLGNAELLKAVQHNPDENLAREPSSVPADLTASDTDSVSSGSTSGRQEYGGGGVVSGRPTAPRGIVVSARFWQETNSRLRRLQDPGSPLSTSPGSRMVGPPKGLQSKRFSTDSPLSSPRTMPSPIRGAMRPASPSKLLAHSVSASPSRGNFSPSRVRNSMAGNFISNSSDAPSILSFSADLRRGKVGENRVVDAHVLRLLYNRHLQWRFVNARADAACLVQKQSAEKNLWNAWITISELRRSVTIKRTKMLLLRQKLKLSSILKGQMTYLEDWALLDREHSSSLLAANEALKASTLRLPIVGKAVADIQSLKDAIGSAVDVMQAMGSSICSLLSKVEEVNSLMTELVNVTAKEQASLDQCKDFLCSVATMQVNDCSLRTHVLQLNRVPTTGSLTTRV